MHHSTHFIGTQRVSILCCILAVGLACRSEPPPVAALSESELSAVILPIDLANAVPCSTEVTGTLVPAAAGYWPYRIFEVAGQAGGILTAELSTSRAPAQLLLTRREDDAFRVLDSVHVEESGRIALEVPEDGTYQLVVASGTDQEGLFTLRTATRAPHRFAPGGDPAASYALIASVEDYPRERVDLTGPHRDAQLVRDVLVNVLGFPEENVVMLRDEEVTRRSLTEAWLAHLRRAGPEGLALFYYSGHGIQIDPLDESSPPEEDAKDEALLLADGSVLVDQELGVLAEGLRAGRAMVVLDNCYAGTGTRGNAGLMKRTLVENLDFELRLPGRLYGTGSTKSVVEASPAPYVLLAASDEDEVAWVSTQPPEASAPAPVSVFTWYLVRELSTLSDTATLDEVMQNVNRRTSSFVRRTFGDDQTPHLEGSEVSGPIARFFRGR